MQLILNFYNALDGWVQKSKTLIPPNAPTSNPFTFNASLYHSWCKGIQNCYQTYYGIGYKFNTILFILSNPGGEVIDEEYTYNSDNYSTNLKFCKTDLYYSEISPSCTNLLPGC